jgi:hypothetical protein
MGTTVKTGVRWITAWMNSISVKFNAIWKVIMEGIVKNGQL